MKWKEYTIKTTTIAEDLVVDMLVDLGIEGAEIIDNVPLTEKEVKEMFIDIEAELPEDNGEGMVRFYLDEDCDEEPVLKQVEEGLKELGSFMDVGECTITRTETDQKDWIDNWKEFFKPFYLDDILIKPSWEEIPEGAKYSALVEIDPQTSFGTGHHETTQLCIKGLKKVMKEGDLVLDLGTGSGILSVIALKLGAKHIIGTDIDPICMGSTKENMDRNHISEDCYETYVGNLIGDEEFQKKIGFGLYDVVLANILADVIIPMAKAAYNTVKVGGYFVTSGIIDFKEPSVKEALVEAGFEIIDVLHMGEWVGIIGKRVK